MQVVRRNLTRLPCDFPADFDIDAYQIFQGMPQRVLCDGDSLNLGGREIRVIHTPGHHQLDIPVSLIADIEIGFVQSAEAEKFKQGNGLFEFHDFIIHI